MREVHNILMRCENLDRYTEGELKRLVGFKRELFDLMVEVLTVAE